MFWVVARWPFIGLNEKANVVDVLIPKYGLIANLVYSEDLLREVKLLANFSV